jgi:hypothetical protein
MLAIGMVDMYCTLSISVVRVVHNFYKPKLKFYSGEIFPFGKAPKLKFYCGALAHFWGPLGPFWCSGAQNQILLWGHFSFWGVSQTQWVPKMC